MSFCHHHLMLFLDSNTRSYERDWLQFRVLWLSIYYFITQYRKKYFVCPQNQFLCKYYPHLFIHQSVIYYLIKLRPLGAFPYANVYNLLILLILSNVYLANQNEPMTIWLTDKPHWLTDWLSSYHHPFIKHISTDIIYTFACCVISVGCCCLLLCFAIGLCRACFWTGWTMNCYSILAPYIDDVANDKNRHTFTYAIPTCGAIHMYPLSAEPRVEEY